MSDVALEVRRMSKSYPGVHALRDVDLRLMAGEIRGVVGENGAGKSTLMKSIAGAVDVDGGELVINGRNVTTGDPKEAAAAGLGMIYQELSLVPYLSAEENVFLGGLPRTWGWVRRRELRRRYARVAERVGLTIPAGAPVHDLSTADQQLLEIARVLAGDRRVIVMDEPTASLGPSDIERLHGVMRELRREGHAILYVSHDLDAVLDICDAVTVLREGAVVETRVRPAWSKAGLVRAMLGGAGPTAPAASGSQAQPGGELLVVESLSGDGVHVPELRVCAGEIVGVAGLVGSGRTRLLRTLVGANRARSGRMTVRGVARPMPTHPRTAWRLGIALAPEDRKRQGLLLHRGAGWNTALGWFRAAAGSPVVRASRLDGWAAGIAEAVGFDSSRIRSAAGTLSGGNQQKLMLARIFGRPVDVVLLDEPTRGIDIGAKAHVFDSMRRLASSGRAVIWSSSEIDEVVEHSDRVLVVAGGRVIAELPAGSSVHDVLEHVFGGDRGRAGQVAPASAQLEGAS